MRTKGERSARLEEMPVPQAGGRIEYMDLLRIFAIAAVVFIHASAVKSDMTSYGSPVWHFTNVFNSLTSVGVPLFVMISGALLLGSPRTLSVGYALRRRVLRLLVPFLAWSFVFIGYRLVVAWSNTGSADWAAAVDKIVHLPVRPVEVPLWFMYVIIPLYLLSPLLKRMVDALSRELVIYLVTVWAVFSCLVPTIATFVAEPKGFSVGLDLQDLTVAPLYIGYFVIGHYLARSARQIRKRSLVAFIVADWALMALGSWWMTSTKDYYDPSGFVGYSSIFTAGLAVAVFLLFKQWSAERPLGRVTGKTVRVIAPMVFGIYLVHFLPISILTNWRPVRSLGLQIAYYLAELSISILCVVVLSAIKPLCYLLTGQPFRAWWKRDKPA